MNNLSSDNLTFDTRYALIKDDYEYLKRFTKESDSNYKTFFDSIPEVDFAYDKVMRWNPSTGENDRGKRISLVSIKDFHVDK